MSDVLPLTVSEQLKSSLDCRLSLAAVPTPLPYLRGVSAQYNTDVWLKRDDWNHDTAAGTKLRRLEYILWEAKEAGATDLITMGQVFSSQFRMLAALGPELDMAVHLLTPGTSEPALEQDNANFFLSQWFGAVIHYLTDKEWKFYPLAVERLKKRLKKEGRTPFVISLGAVEPIGMLGMIDLARELFHLDEEDRRFSHIFLPAGTGATLFGLDLALSLNPELISGRDVHLFGVSVHEDEPALRKMINGYAEDFNKRFGVDIQPTDRICIVDSHRGAGYGAVTGDDLENARMLARQFGLLVDPCYVLRPFMAMLDFLRGNRMEAKDKALFLVTGPFYNLLFSKSDQQATD